MGSKFSLVMFRGRVGSYERVELCVILLSLLLYGCLLSIIMLEPSRVVGLRVSSIVEEALLSR